MALMSHTSLREKLALNLGVGLAGDMIVNNRPGSTLTSAKVNQMNINESEINCPFCGESIEIVIDPSEDLQDYIEDCSVCCRPIRFQVLCANGELIQIQGLRE